MPAYRCESGSCGSARPDHGPFCFFPGRQNEPIVLQETPKRIERRWSTGSSQRLWQKGAALGPMAGGISRNCPSGFGKGLPCLCPDEWRGGRIVPEAKESIRLSTMGSARSCPPGLWRLLRRSACSSSCCDGRKAVRIFVVFWRPVRPERRTKTHCRRPSASILLTTSTLPGAMRIGGCESGPQAGFFYPIGTLKPNSRKSPDRFMMRRMQRPDPVSGPCTGNEETRKRYSKRFPRNWWLC